jgi:large subunit ribosomal protein L24
MDIKKSDNIYVTTGKDKGKIGKVIAAYPKTNTILVEKINLVKKHLKPTKSAPHGGIQSIERPISIAKVSLICPNCSKSTKVANKIINDKKNRFCKKCNELIG